MNGITIAWQGSINAVGDQAWEVEGIGDFDGDGKADILWRNLSTGENYIWLMNGLSTASQVSVNFVDPASGWQVQGVGDFDGDGKADILWRNTSTGQNYIYLMNGLPIVSQGPINAVTDLNWQVQAVGDYNGDGKADILWRNSSNADSYLSLSATNPALAPLPLLLWSAGMKMGDLSEWSEKVNSASADTTVVSAASAGIPPGDSTYVMMQAVAGTPGGTSMRPEP